MSGTSQWAMSEPNIAVELGAERVDLGLNAVRRHRVVGLAAEVEAVDEQVA